MRQRTLAFGLGAGLTLAGVWGGAVVLVLAGIAAQPPDPLAIDYGDPCCPVPDTWGEVAGWSLLALVVAVLDAALLVLGGALVRFALRRRRPTRRAALLPLAAAPLVAAVILIGQVAAR